MEVGEGVNISKESISNITYHNGRGGRCERNRMLSSGSQHCLHIGITYRNLKILMCGSHLRNSVIGYSLSIRVTDAVTFENDCVKDPSGPFLGSSSSHRGCT